jgi:hypothetical protein
MTKKSPAKKRSAAKKRPAAKRHPAAKKRVAAKKRPTAKKRSAAKKRPAAKKPAARRKRPAPAAGAASAPPKAGPLPPSSAIPSSRPAPPAGRAPAVPAGRAAFGKDAGIRVRMYRVGFGDFFLLSLRAPDDTARHILVDCGVHAANIGAIGAAIDQLATDTGKQLSLVIMTHRHADHISGFSSGKDVFATFNVERVWMPWYDDPKNKAAASLQATLTALAANLQIRLAARNDPATAEAEQMANNITGTMSAVGGQTSNTDALDTLQHGFKAPVDYYKAGDTPTLPASLVQAGLTAQILGPPIDQALVQQMDGKGHQYLAANADDGAPPKRFDPVFDYDGAKYPDAAFELYTREEVERAVADAQPDLELAKAAQSDQFLNNQSLVVLFGFGGKKLLFAGDAQWGNWQNFLFGGTLGTPGHTGLTSAAKTILDTIDFYKVGHHGSTNATPIDALNAMKDGVVAMCSTNENAYGKVANKSEVPRIPLLAALEKKTRSQLARSDMVAAGTEAACKPDDVESIPPLQAPFTAGPNGQIYVDYEM